MGPWRRKGPKEMTWPGPYFQGCEEPLPSIEEHSPIDATLLSSCGGFSSPWTQHRKPGRGLREHKSSKRLQWNCLVLKDSGQGAKLFTKTLLTPKARFAKSSDCRHLSAPEWVSSRVGRASWRDSVPTALDQGSVAHDGQIVQIVPKAEIRIGIWNMIFWKQL